MLLVLENLNSNDSNLNEISKDAPFVGGTIKIALHIIGKVYEGKVPVQKRLSLTLMTFFEKYRVKTIVPTIPTVCARLSISENPNSETISNF